MQVVRVAVAHQACGIPAELAAVGWMLLCLVQLTEQATRLWLAVHLSHQRLVV